MSIFKDTLKDDVYNQIKSREKVISGKNSNRDPLLPWYLSKNSWVRMTSFVNYDEGTIVDYDGYGNLTLDTTQGNYTGFELSKKYILQGGTLNTLNNKGSLRKGLMGDGSVYGSDLDYANGNETPWFRTHGIRPMPGIVNVDLKTINAYGSIYEATVKFYAWDTHQLNELEILFMRPGYSVLLEWGWSQYIDNTGKSQVFDGGGINPFASNLTQQKVYDQLEGLRKKHNYNYDGMLGYIKNFSWTMMSNGGYECTTSLISIGEVMTSLRIAPSSNYFANKNQTLNTSRNTQTYYDDYETILLSLKYKAEAAGSPGFSKATGTDIYTINEDRFRGKFNKENAVSVDDIVKKLTENEYISEAEELKNEPFVKPLNTGDESKNLGLRYEYISLPVWIAIMDSYFSYKFKDNDKATSKLVRFLPPGKNDFCLAGKDSITTDLSVCAINNPLAFPEFNNIQPDYYTSTGIDPMLSQNKNYVINGQQPVVSLPSFYDDNLKVGYIGYIFVNIDLLFDTYNQMKTNSNGDGAVLIEYVQNILNKINGALGGINDFKLSTASRDQNILRIIDLFYLEQKSGYSSKKKLNLTGLNTIFKDVKVVSKIFPEQSTMVAIAAQSRANLGTIYNSSQVYLNAGITDRLAPEKGQGDELKKPKTNDSDPTYQKLLDFLIYIKKGVVGQSEGDQGWKIDPQVTNPTGNYLKSFLLKYDGEIGFKALIPFTLTVTLEGLGGFVIGQIFTIEDNGILPKNYIDKKLGFIITRIFHRLNDNNWETTLETQICLLDQQQFYENNISILTKNLVEERKNFQKWVDQAKIDSILYPIMSDFIRYFFYKTLAGYILAAYESEYLTEDDSIEAIINNYIKSNNTTNFNEYWKKNVLYFLNNGTEYNLKNFIDFTFNWIDNYQKLHATDGKLNVQFTSDYTVNQALEIIKQPSFQGIIVNTFTETYRKQLNEIELLFLGVSNENVSPASWFYPGGTNSLFTNPQELIVDKNVNISGLPFVVNSLNETLINNRIDSVIASQFPNLISNFNNLKTQDKTSINTLFVPNSQTLYPTLQIYDPNSLQLWGKKIIWGSYIVKGDVDTSTLLIPQFDTI